MSRPNINLLSDRVLILPIEVETKTSGGIIIPDSAKEKPLKGQVIAVGPGNSREDMEVQEGEFVMYTKYAGTDITLEGKDYLIMRQSDCLLVVK